MCLKWKRCFPKNSKVTGFDEVPVCEDVAEHYEYWKEAVNFDKNDCCNLKRSDSNGKSL